MGDDFYPVLVKAQHCKYCRYAISRYMGLAEHCSWKFLVGRVWHAIRKFFGGTCT